MSLTSGDLKEEIWDWDTNKMDTDIQSNEEEEEEEEEEEKKTWNDWQLKAKNGRDSW